MGSLEIVCYNIYFFLGGLKYEQKYELVNSNCNNLLTGAYMIYEGSRGTNYPMSYGTILSINNGEAASFGAQFAVSNYNEFFYRFKDNATDAWQDWLRADNLRGGKMARVSGSKANIEVAKDCFASLSDYSWGIWDCSSSVSSNCYIYVYRESSTVGLIEITEVSTGQTQRYKRGYSDSDFVLVN